MTATIPRSAIVAACAEMIRACGLTLAELADELGKPQRATESLSKLPVAGEVDIDAVHVRKPAPRPAQSEKPALSRRAEQVLDLAHRPAGATIEEIAGLLGAPYGTGAYHAERLVQRRMLTKVKVRGEHAFRYWTNPAHALAYVEARNVEAEQRDLDAAERERQERSAKSAAPKPEKPTKVAKLRQALTITPPKIDDNAMRPRGEAIKTEKTVETCDTTVRPTAKWQRLELPPDPRYPSFSSMPPGVDPRTGKAWGATA